MDRQLDVKRATRAGTLILGAFMFCACAAPQDNARESASMNEPPVDSSVDDDVLAELQYLGFATDHVEVEGDVVRVEGDMIFSRQALLRGDYATELRQQHGERLNKGYIYGPLVSAANAGNIKLVFATGTYAPSASWQTAFNSAAADWSAVPANAIRISTTKTGPSITVKMLSTTWPGVSGCQASSDACANIPSGGAPGAVIWVKSDWGAPEPCSMTPSVRRGLAIHELGHAIGMAHPKESGSSNVSGTMSCGGTSSTCPNTPGYDTVMRATVYFYAWPDCTAMNPYTPTTDDIATIATLY